MSKRATITDVASRAGVSIKTVSRVLNRERNVREAVRARVLAAAKQLGYAPSLSARGLAGARSYVLALLFDHPSFSYLAEVQGGALERCRAAHYHLIVEPVETGALTKRTIEETLASARPDALILTPPVCDSALALDAIEQAGLSHVRIAPGRNLDRGPWVRANDREAARALTERLIDMGHAEIAFIRGHPDHGAAAERHTGYVDALGARGLSVDDGLVAQGDFSFESGVAAAEALLDLVRRPTAIFAGGDDIARGVMVAAERRGLEVPRDLSVAGFDDSPASRRVWPPLTTVRQPIRAMAAAAADLAMALACDPQTKERTRSLPCEIVMRGTTAAPRG